MISLLYVKREACDECILKSRGIKQGVTFGRFGVDPSSSRGMLLLLLIMIHTFSVLSLQLKKLR